MHFRDPHKDMPDFKTNYEASRARFPSTGGFEVNLNANLIWKVLKYQVALNYFFMNDGLGSKMWIIKIIKSMHSWQRNFIGAIRRNVQSKTICLVRKFSLNDWSKVWV